MAGYLISDVLLFWLVLTCCIKQIIGPNHCDTNAECLNGGTCNDDRSCTCVAGWKANNCEDYDHDCDPNPCLQGGSCAQMGSGNSKYWECTCVSGTSGTRCETGTPANFQTGPTDAAATTQGPTDAATTQGPTDAVSTHGMGTNGCDSGPCQNGGTCNSDGSGGYTCACDSGFSGTHCETKLPVSVTMPAAYSYDHAVEKCKEVGLQLCTYDDVCPGDIPVYGVKVGLDRWTPISDEYNSWVQIGDSPHPACKVHDPPPPSWGTTVTAGNYKDVEVFCCDAEW